MFPDSQSEADAWISVITKNIDTIKNPKVNIPSTLSSSNIGGNANTSGNSNTKVVQQQVQQKVVTPEPIQDIDEGSEPRFFNPNKDSVRTGLENARDLIPYLQPGQDGSEEGRIFEFWQIWSESIPARNELEEGAIIFEVSASADLEKLSWRASGPQHIFIQKMVDFFLERWCSRNRNRSIERCWQ